MRRTNSCGTDEKCATFWPENLTGEGSLGDVRVNRRKTLKQLERKACGLDSLGTR
jgi:hypothetical protein